MAAVQRGLGRGLDALFQGMDEETGATQGKGIALVPMDDIRPNPHQPRRDFEDEALRELSESIRSSGVLQPILIRPLVGDNHLYELVAGERRWRAGRMAGLREIPAMVRELDDQESLAIALIENLQREDLNPIEEALGMKRLQEDFGLKQEELAAKVGKSRPAIANILRLLQLPEDIQRDIRDGRLSAGHGRSLLAVGDDEARETLRTRCMDQALSVREAEAQVSYWKKTGVMPGEVAPKASARGKAKPASTLPEEIQVMQDRLAAILGVPVAVRGSLDKGRIVFGYNSAEELAGLLHRLEGPEAPSSDADSESSDITGNDQSIVITSRSAPRDAVQDMLDGHEPQPASAADDEPAPDREHAGVVVDEQGDDDLSDFDDDELADLDRALDEILEETKKM